MDNGRNMQILEITVIIALFIWECAVAKILMEKYSILVSFIGMAIEVFAIGGLTWWLVKKHIKT